MRRIIIFLIVLVSIGGIGYAISRGNASREPDVFADDVPAAGSSTASTAPIEHGSALATSSPATESVGADLRSYSNKQFHFSLLFPQSLQVTEYKEQGGALTVTFENLDADQQFQIYVAPYTDRQVSAKRFNQDEPSGVREQPTDVLVDGVRATMFFSSNAIMGDTREVWFIRGGYLYEITTYKPLDTWLATIMQTWRFI